MRALLSDSFCTVLPRNGSQEITLSGSHVRTIGGKGWFKKGLDGEAHGIAANNDVLVVTTTGTRGVWVFDLTSGKLVRSFGEKGGEEGQLDHPDGVRFTPDGGHILIAEGSSRPARGRLSLFSLNGDFVRCMRAWALEGPADIDFAPSGDILVVDSYRHHICVLSPEGSTLLRWFGHWGTASAPRDGDFQSPVALAMHRGQLYVLDGNSARVQVFA